MSRLLACSADILSPCVPLPAFKNTFESVDYFVASLRIIDDFNFLLHDDWQKIEKTQCWATSAGTFLSFLCSDISISLSFLNHLKLIDVKGIAFSLASTSIFGTTPLAFVAQLALSPTIFYTAFLGYFLMTVDSLYRLEKGDTSSYNVVVLTRGLAETTYRTYLVAAGTFLFTPAGQLIAAILAAIAAAMAIMSVHEQIQLELHPSKS